ncbi:SCO family protein [Roseateles sp. DC23W]|uniref:SCO family protein n=1 Tax=Pelomonas dachongensis TaxID=3299029 RepID=A0ABW7ENF7_9BURK
MATSPEPLSFAVHSLPDPRASTVQRAGRWKMLVVLAMCAAPVVASYFTFYVVKPSGSAYGELISPTVDMPADLPLTDLQGRTVTAASLRGQWMLAVAQPPECSAACERQLFVQRQLREMLGKEKDRVDKLWLVPGDAPLRPELVAAVSQKGAEVTVLRVPADRLDAWLKPAAGKMLADHFYVIDPMGRWMLRAPGDPEPTKLKADLVRLLKSSAFWDPAGR